MALIQACLCWRVKNPAERERPASDFKSRMSANSITRPNICTVRVYVLLGGGQWRQKPPRNRQNPTQPPARDGRLGTNSLSVVSFSCRLMLM